MWNHPGVCNGSESDNERTYVGTGTCELLELLERLCQGHEKLQNVMRSHHMLSIVADFLEDVERSCMTALLADDIVTALTLVKGFRLLSAAIGGPNNQNRLVLTRTNVISMMNRLFAKLRYDTEDADVVQQGFKATIRCSAMRLLAQLVQTPIELLVAKRVIDTLDWVLLLRSWPDVHQAFEHALVELDVSTETFLRRHGQRTSLDIMQFLDGFSKLVLEVRPKSMKNEAETHAMPLNTTILDSAGAIDGVTTNPVANASTVPKDSTNGKVSRQEAQKVLSTRMLAADMAEESLLLALTILTLQGENVFGYYASLKGREELLTNVLDDIPDTVSFYTARIASVEIVRKHVLQRLYFCLPESSVWIAENKHILDRLDATLYDDLPTDNEKERQVLSQPQWSLRTALTEANRDTSWSLLHPSFSPVPTAGRMLFSSVWLPLLLICVAKWSSLQVLDCFMAHFA